MKKRKCMYDGGLSAVVGDGMDEQDSSQLMPGMMGISDDMAQSQPLPSDPAGSVTVNTDAQRIAQRGIPSVAGKPTGKRMSMQQMLPFIGMGALMGMGGNQGTAMSIPMTLMMMQMMKRQQQGAGGAGLAGLLSRLGTNRAPGTTPAFLGQFTGNGSLSFGNEDPINLSGGGLDNVDTYGDS